MNSTSINLGDRVTDQVSGLEGVVTARIEYINGCIQFGVTPAAKDGKLPDTLYFDWKRLKITGERLVLSAEDTGGPQHDAPRSR